MKRIKQRLLSLAMTGALLLGFTLPDAFASGARSSNESGASETLETKSEKSSKKQSKNKTTKSQAEEKSTEAEEEATEKAESDEAKTSSSKSEKTETSEKKAKSSNEKVSLTLSISKPGGLSASDGVWQVDSDKVSALTLSWKCKGDCDSFEVSVSGGVYSASTEKKSAKIPVSGLSEGKYTATVKAIRDGKTVAREKLSFQIIADSVDETSEALMSESVEIDGVDESANQQAQSESGILAEGEDTVEQTRDTKAEQTAGQAQDTEAEQTVEEAQDTLQGQSFEETQDASADRSETANLPESQESELVEETQDPSTDQAQDASGEQPDQDEIVAFEDAFVEELNDAAIELSPREECLDLSEADIQPPQENPIEEVQAISEETLPDVTVTVLDAPEVQLDEADEAQNPDEHLDETVLMVGESESIFSNAGDEKEKNDKKLNLSVMGAEGLSVIDGAVHINPAQASAVTLVWSFGGTCDEYAVSVSGGVYDKTTKKSQLKLPVKRLSSGQYTVTVTANKDGKALSSARLSFIVDAADSEGASTGLAITVASPQGLLITDGIYQVDPTQAEALTFTWQYGGECDAYDVSVSGGIYSGRTEEGTVTVPLSDLGAGTYTVTVVALMDDKAVTQAQLSFNIPSQDEKPEDDPGKGGRPQGGGQRSGGQKSGTAKDGEGQAVDQGFHVTPGEALTNTHTSGNRDTRLYGAVALTLDAEIAMDVLTLGDTALDIRLSDGGLFNALIDGNTLALVPRGEAQTWLLNGYALKTLARSGVTSLRLTLDDMTVEFPTLPELSGSNYGALCAAGRTSRDYSFAVSSDGCTVTVAGQTFQLTAEGELV